MNRDFQNINRIDAVSDFIDLLNTEKKPQINDDYEEDIEMQQLFETVRAVRRLKNCKIEAKDESGIKQNSPLGRYLFPYKGMTAIAAAIILVFISAKIIMAPQNNLTTQKTALKSPESSSPRALEPSQNSAADIALKQDVPKIMESTEPQPMPKSGKKAVNSEVERNVMKSSDNVAAEDMSKAPETAPQEASIAGIMEAPQAKMFTGNNITYAMDRAYGDLSAYSGNVEIRYEDRTGKVSSSEKIEVKYKKPGRYMAVIEKDNMITTKISDGEKLYVINTDGVRVNYLSSDEGAWKYLIGESIDRLKKTTNFEQIGDEIIGEKDTFIYEFGFNNGEILNRIWIDKATNLPIKQELNMPDGTKITSRLTKLDVNPNLDDSIFKYEIKEGQKVNYE